MTAAEASVDPGSTSVSLISRAKMRDAEAWERLCRIYGPLIYRWIRRAKMSDADAAEIAQEALLAVSRRLDAFDPASEKGAFRGWLRGIVRNKVGDRIRVQRRSVPTYELPCEFPAEEESQEEIRSELQALLRRALRTLEFEFESRTWTAFERTAFQGLSAADVAQELGMTSKAVRQARYRVLSRLRLLMQDENLG